MPEITKRWLAEYTAERTILAAVIAKDPACCPPGGLSVQALVFR